jgi:hypothetical protein
VNRTTADGLGDNFVSAIYVVGSTIYAGTSGGLSISTDGGGTWQNFDSTDGLADDYVNDVFVEGGKIYVATDNGLSISTNGGSTWATRNTSNTPNFGSDSVKGVSAEGQFVFAATVSDGTSTGGFSFSYDGGSAFTNFTTIDGLGSNAVTGIFLSSMFWLFSTDGGLSLGVKPSTYPDDFPPWFQYANSEDGLGCDTLNGVHASNDYYVVASTCGVSVSENMFQFYDYDTTDGLGSDQVHNVFVDGTTIYAATSAGLSINRPLQSSPSTSTPGSTTNAPDPSVPSNVPPTLPVTGSESPGSYFWFILVGSVLVLVPRLRSRTRGVSEERIASLTSEN